ncbi:MAG TPA: DUF4193 family protein [Actinomycetota bacterium]|nr:DUF4193 family protein [Actinomycetota bacterium]
MDEPEEIEELEDDDDLEELEIDDPEEAEAELALATTDDDDEDEDASLDELLAQRATARRGGADEPDDEDDDDDIMALATQPEPEVADVAPVRVIPVKDRQEFVCARCHLVKARSQLKDPDRMLCRDCA